MLFIVVAFYLSFKFFANLLSVFCVVLFLFGHNTNAEMVVKTTENGTAKNGLQAQTSDGWFVGFLKTYIFPDKNPIFQDQQNEISVSYLVSYNEPVGYEAAHIQPGGMFRRAVHSF